MTYTLSGGSETLNSTHSLTHLEEGLSEIQLWRLGERCELFLQSLA